jgi:hypothetical protein
VLERVEPGAVILLHDGGGDRSQTVVALATVLRGLAGRGYRMVTLSELYHVPDAGLRSAPGAARPLLYGVVPLYEAAPATTPTAGAKP